MAENVTERAARQELQRASTFVNVQHNPDIPSLNMLQNAKHKLYHLVYGRFQRSSWLTRQSWFAAAETPHPTVTRHFTTHGKTYIRCIRALTGALLFNLIDNSICDIFCSRNIRCSSNE